MISSESFADFHRAYVPDAWPVTPQLFSVHKIVPGTETPYVPYNRRDFYQINLYTSGTTHLTYAGETMLVHGPALVLYHPLAPYSCAAQTPLAGFFCLFTAEFLHGPGYAGAVQESSLLQLGAHPVTALTDGQSALLSQLFQQMLAEVDSTYRHKYDLLRTYVQLVLHEAQRLRPDLQHPAHSRAASRLAAQFSHVLEQQFPISSPTRPLALHNAEAVAARLGVHVNYLNRVLRQVTGRTTSALLAERVAQEAKALLRHTDWSVADISDSLSFANPTYFAHFFRKHAGTSPKAFRQQAELAPALASE